ncbi:MAG: YraN family protein [candidate division WOR-3 bacterium]|nr:YraN family protein [candidate division WOR-3 bacterium]MCX7757946.1 YraN family protein [candidate division WOR-3 bacterium]MDW7987293.1 YraN family protein [candidate division WOR-3 bacterium]
MKKLGLIGEQLAIDYLKSLGYKILAKNYRCPIGEIDIIAQDQDVIVFVEVKTRKSDAVACPYESVGQHKQQKIKEVAQWYLEETSSENCETRFDVLSIVMKSPNPDIEHFREAF